MSFNTPVRHLQGGSVLEVASSGTVKFAAGGSIQGPVALESVNAADGTFAGTISLGGTVGRWAFGSATLASGTALVYTGLSQIVDAGASYLAPLSAGTGAGSATSFQVNPSRFANGTAYFLGLTGTSAFTGAGTITWRAFGY